MIDARIAAVLAIRPCTIAEHHLSTCDARTSSDADTTPALVPRAAPNADLSHGSNAVIRKQAPALPELAQDTHITVMQKRKGGRPATKRQPILALLHAHPEGLTAEQIRAYLNSTHPIGDVLAGMRRSGAVRVEGTGHAMRYFALPS